MIEQVPQITLIQGATFVGGTISGALLHFIFRDYLNHRLSRRVKRKDDAEEWCVECRSCLSKLISAGNQIIAKGDADREIYAELTDTAQDLVALSRNPPKLLDKDDSSLLDQLNEIGHTVLVYEEVAGMETDNFSEAMGKVNDIYDRLHTDDIEIEKALNEVGGLPTGVQGESIQTEHVMEMVEFFVDELAPGLEFSEVATVEDLMKISWGLMDEEVPRKKREELLNMALVRGTQAGFVRMPLKAIESINEFENSL